MIPLIIFIVLNTISLTLAAIFDGEEREIKFSYSFIRIVIESLGNYTLFTLIYKNNILYIWILCK